MIPRKPAETRIKHPAIRNSLGGTDESPEDQAWPVWAGQLPVVSGVGEAIAEAGVTVDALPTLPRGLRGLGTS